MKGRFERKGDPMNLYGIYDKAIKSYVDFIVNRHNADVVRMCGMLVNRDGSIQHAYADDFELVKLGEIDEKSGEVFCCSDVLCVFSSLLRGDFDD